MKYFTTQELKCKCNKCNEVVYNQELLNILDEVREELGESIIVNSCCRCANHNKNIGGSPKSRHLHGNAVDLHIKNNNYRFRLMKLLLNKGVSILVYRTFIHIQLDLEPKIVYMD